MVAGKNVLKFKTITRVLAPTLALLTARPMLASADDAVTLEPSSPWNLNGTENSCALRRTFGDAVHKTELQIKRIGPGDGFDLIIVGNDLPNGNLVFQAGQQPLGAISQVRGKMLLDGVGQASAVSASAKLGAFAKLGETVAPVTPEMEASATTIEMRAGDGALILDTGSLGKPFAALRRCTDAMVTKWGLDPAQQAALKSSAQPTNDPRLWLKATDLAGAEFERSRLSGTALRLLIDEDGRASGCAVISGDAKLEKAICQAISRRARFKPAVASDGKAVASYWFDRIR